MNRPTQTDRLETGHIATFVWNTSAQQPCIGSWRVVESLNTEGHRTTEPPEASQEWLKPFMGKGILTMAAVAEQENNERVMLLVGIDIPDSTSAFFNSVAHAPDWYQRLPGLWLEGIWYSPRRDELLAGIPDIFEKLAA